MHESVEIYVKGFDAPTPPIQRDGVLVIIIGFNYSCLWLAHTSYRKTPRSKPSPCQTQAISIMESVQSSKSSRTVTTEASSSNLSTYGGVERDEIAGKISVMGRSSLNAKLLLVQALKTCFRC
ncbi:hypothetical protein Peur_023306 [Populus x canadensis]